VSLLFRPRFAKQKCDFLHDGQIVIDYLARLLNDPVFADSGRVMSWMTPQALSPFSMAKTVTCSIFYFRAHPGR
jgi:hypothetical protein